MNRNAGVLGGDKCWRDRIPLLKRHIWPKRTQAIDKGWRCQCYCGSTRYIRWRNRWYCIVCGRWYRAFGPDLDE